jgi:nuclear pore complex protein Nup50
LFYFNDKEKKFSDRGIGNLFIKPSKDDQYQLIVRADNKLANILLNVKLTSMFPVGKEAAKDVSYVCLPNPPIQNVDSQVPCKFLFKVKTEADADELFAKLNEYKK